MNCRYCEERMSDYIDRTLPPAEMEVVLEHLDTCASCAELARSVRTLLAECKTYPVLEPDLALVERILLRTSGRPRRRTLRELITEHLVSPILTPRFAAGAALSLLFVAFAIHWISPRVGDVASVLAPRQVFRNMDRAAQGVYSEGLRLYDKKNEWQAQFSYIKNNVFTKLGLMIEQLDVPEQGHEKSGEPGQQQKKNPSEKSSLLLLPA